MPRYRVTTEVIARTHEDALNAAIKHNSWLVERMDKLQRCALCFTAVAEDGETTCAECAAAIAQ